MSRLAWTGAEISGAARALLSEGEQAEIGERFRREKAAAK